MTEVTEFHRKNTNKKGSHTAHSYRSTYVLLNCDESEHSQGKITNEKISRFLKTGMQTIDRIKQKFVEGGITQVLNRSENKFIYNKKGRTVRG